MKLPPDNLLIPPRGARLPGVAYTIIRNGHLYWRSWPKRRGAARSPAEAEAQKVFAGASQITLYMDAYQQAFARRIAQQTWLLPRDMLMLALYSRIGTIITRTGTKVYSMAAMQDVSLLLDAIGQTRGGIAIRGDNFWDIIPPGPPNSVLTIDQDGNYRWVPSGTPGGSGYLSASADGSTTAANNTNFACHGNVMKLNADLEVGAITAALNPAVSCTAQGVIAKTADYQATTTFTEVHLTPPITITASPDTRRQRMVLPNPVQFSAGENIFFGIVMTSASGTSPALPTVVTANINQPLLAGTSAQRFVAASIAPAPGGACVLSAAPTNLLRSLLEFRYK